MIEGSTGKPGKADVGSSVGSATSREASTSGMGIRISARGRSELESTSDMDAKLSGGGRLLPGGCGGDVRGGIAWALGIIVKGSDSDIVSGTDDATLILRREALPVKVKALRLPPSHCAGEVNWVGGAAVGARVK